MKTIGGHRKKLRKGGIALLLLGAALLIAGCNWATTVGFPKNPNTYIVVHHDFTDRIVWTCTGKYGSGNDRGRCAERTLYALCKGAPVSGLPASKCDGAINDDGTIVEQAIVELLNQGRGCLRLTIDRTLGQNITLYEWDAVVLGYPGCSTAPSD